MRVLWKLILMVSAAGLATAAAAAPVNGTVKDPQGRPVAGATVALYSVTGSGGYRVTTDSAGNFQFPDLPAGDFILQADASGFASFLADNVHAGENAATHIDIALRLAGLHENVTVTASATPQIPEAVSKALTVVDESEAAERDRASISDVIDLVPGLRVQQLGGPGALATIHIRGMRPQDTAILVDGIRLRDASSTQGDATGLLEDLFFTDANRIEVLRGSGSSLYGTNAIGGVVNVITDPGGGRTRGSLLAEAGSLGFFRIRGQVAGAFRKDQIPYSVGVSELYSGDGVDGDDPFRATNLHGRMAFSIVPGIRISARLYAGDSFGKLNSEPVALASGGGVIPGIGASPAVRRAYERGSPVSELNLSGATFIPGLDDPDSTRAGRFLSGALVLDGHASPSLDYSATYQLVTNSRRFGDGPAGAGFQPGGNTRAVYDGRIHTLNAGAAYRLGRFHLLSGGYEFESENFGNDTSALRDPAAASAVSVTQRSSSLFLQDQVHFLDDRLQLSGAFRAQYFALERPNFSPAGPAPFQTAHAGSPPDAYTGDGSAAYFFKHSGTKVRTHVGRGYRAPSLFERFGAGFDSVFGYSIFGDPRLRPEYSLSLDAGIDQTLLHSRMRMSATYFYTWLQRTIAFDSAGLIQPATDPFGRFFGYLNRPGGISRGVELSAAGSPIAALNISAAYTFVNAIERAPVVGNILESFVIPRHQFSLLIAGRLTRSLTVTFDARASGDYLAPVFGEAGTRVYRFEGIRKINLGASYRRPLSEFTAIRFFVRAENLSDQRYFENGFATTGRTGRGGVQFEF